MMLALPAYRLPSGAAGVPSAARPFVVRETTALTPPKPRLLDRVRAALRSRQALSALLFLYREVLEVDLPWLDGVARAQRPADRMFAP